MPKEIRAKYLIFLFTLFTYLPVEDTFVINVQSLTFCSQNIYCSKMSTTDALKVYLKKV